jgi:uncharacterized membrane protein YuzA (DUF378 family)
MSSLYYNLVGIQGGLNIGMYSKQFCNELTDKMNHVAEVDNLTNIRLEQNISINTNDDFWMSANLVGIQGGHNIGMFCKQFFNKLTDKANHVTEVANFVRLSLYKQNLH